MSEAPAPANRPAGAGGYDAGHWVWGAKKRQLDEALHASVPFPLADEGDEVLYEADDRQGLEKANNYFRLSDSISRIFCGHKLRC